MSEPIKATVFIPTYNGEKYLRPILKSIFEQQVNFRYEVLIIDSGSTDKTLSIIHSFEKKNKNLRLVEIDNADFGHGKTRNYAAKISKGELIVYLSHDAVPSNKHWLYEMTKPFDLNEKIVGVVGKQVPRPKCVPLLKYEIRGVFKAFGPNFGTTLFYKDSFLRGKALYDATTFYSDVNSATRRDFLLDTIPYKDVPYAEDHIFGRDIINSGYIKAYAPRGSVVHSNDLKLREYKHRMFDEILGIRRLKVMVHIPSRKFILKMVVTGSLKDAIRTAMDKEYSFKRKVFWLLVNPLYHIEKWRGIRTASKVSINDEDMVTKHSLEKMRNI
jgi:rhamnosyltransferase